MWLWQPRWKSWLVTFMDVFLFWLQLQVNKVTPCLFDLLVLLHLETGVSHSCNVMACANAALTRPQITQTPYTLHSFSLGGLSQQKSCKGISCWSPLLPEPVCVGLCFFVVFFVCVCFPLPPAFTTIKYIPFTPRTDNKGSGCQTDIYRIYFPPEELFRAPLSSHNPSLTERFLLLLLPLWLFSHPLSVSLQSYPMHLCYHNVVTHTPWVSNASTHTESGWGHCLESEYYSLHPKGRNPVSPLPFKKHKRLPLREEADSYGMCYQGFLWLALKFMPISCMCVRVDLLPKSI